MEELVAKVKEEGKGDEVLKALKEAVQGATGEQREALRELLGRLEGARPKKD